jgi:cytochrome oxidase Cu insertion factor (SCO1/SenC/PrrC family)
MSPTIKRWLLFAACFALAYAAYKIQHARQARNSESQQQAREMADELYAADASAAKSRARPAKLVAPFTLIDQDGKPYDTVSLKGRVWVGSFFFTACPSVCIRLNQAVSGLLAAEPGSDVHFVSITCDPDNDTPEVLTRYAKHFKADPARWTFLTGELETIKRIGFEEFQVSVQKGEHSDRTFAVDRTGHIRGYYRITEPDQREKLSRLLKTLEAEPAPAAEEGEASAGNASAGNQAAAGGPRQ